MWKALNMSRILPAIALLTVGSAGLSGCASFDEEVDHFQFAALSPVRDVNLLQQPIPQQLEYLSHPYGYAAQSGCSAWASEIEQLEAAIVANDGRRPGFRRDPNTFVGRTGNLRDAGVRALTRSVLPFRGVVRQVSGAAKLEQNANRASDRARYRIGYLVGLARANNCPGFAEGASQLVQTRSPYSYSPAVVRQSYPTLRQAPVTTQAPRTVYTAPMPRSSYGTSHYRYEQAVPTVTQGQTTHAPVYYVPRAGTPSQYMSGYQPSAPVTTYHPPQPQGHSQFQSHPQSAPRTVYHDPASRGRLRSSRR